MKDYNFTPADIARFWAKVDATEGECWEWLAGVSKNGGYGQFGANTTGKRALYIAHRVSYTLLNGPIPEGRQLDHICHNRRCVNPLHLRPVDHKMNSENHQGAQKHSESGVRGVYWHKGAGKWLGQVQHHGVRHNAGLHASIAEAEAAVTALRNRLFTHNDIDRVAA